MVFFLFIILSIVFDDRLGDVHNMCEGIVSTGPFIFFACIRMYYEAYRHTLVSRITDPVRLFPTVCLLASIKVKKQTLPEINVQLFGTLE